MIKSISKKDGKIIAKAIEELLASATVKALQNHPSGQHSFWKGYVETGLKHIAANAEAGSVYLEDEKP